jgi:hypothetical protein
MAAISAIGQILSSVIYYVHQQYSYKEIHLKVLYFQQRLNMKTPVQTTSEEQSRALLDQHCQRQLRERGGGGRVTMADNPPPRDIPCRGVGVFPTHTRSPQADL